MPLAQAAVPSPGNACRPAITATRGVPVNLTVAPRDVRLGIALAAAGTRRPKPKSGGGTPRMKLLPQRDGKLIKIRRRLQPRFPVAIGPVDAHPLARRRLAEVDGVVTVISRPPRRRQSFAVDRPLDFRDGVDDDRVVLDGHNVVKIPVAQQVQIPLAIFCSWDGLSGLVSPSIEEQCRV